MELLLFKRKINAFSDREARVSRTNHIRNATKTTKNIEKPEEASRWKTSTRTPRRARTSLHRNPTAHGSRKATKRRREKPRISKKKRNDRTTNRGRKGAEPGRHLAARGTEGEGLMSADR